MRCDGSDGDGNPSNHLYIFSRICCVAPITERISNGIIAKAELRRPCSIRCEWGPLWDRNGNRWPPIHRQTCAFGGAMVCGRFRAWRCMGAIGHAFSRIQRKDGGGWWCWCGYQYMRTESLTCAAIWRRSLETGFLGNVKWLVILFFSLFRSDKTFLAKLGAFDVKGDRENGADAFFGMLFRI